MQTKLITSKEKITGWIIYKDLDRKRNPAKASYSVRRFCQAAAELNIDLQVITPSKLDILIANLDEPSFYIDGKPAQPPNFVLSRMGAGTSEHILAALRQLESKGVYLANDAAAIENAKDKYKTLQILRSKKIPVAKTIHGRLPVNFKLIINQLGFPLVIKAKSGSQGDQVYLAKNLHEFTSIMREIKDKKINGTPDYARDLIFQEFIKNSSGKDIRVFVLGGKVVACMERSANPEAVKKGEFRSNYSLGGNVSTIVPTRKMKRIAIEAAKALKLEIAGLDLLIDGQDSYIICEANSSPGFDGLEKTTDIDIAKEVLIYIMHKLGHWEF